MKKAFITGGTGQDGAYLTKLLLDKGYEVHIGARRNADRSFWRLEALGINVNKDIKVVDFELLESQAIARIIKEGQYDEFYNLGAQSFVASSFNNPEYTIKTDGVAVVSELEAIRRYSPKTRFYQASTSELYGNSMTLRQNEDTPLKPVSPYGLGKLLAHESVRLYREAYRIKAVCGILYNHESSLRGSEFVTKKVVDYVRTVQSVGVIDNIKPLQIGNMDSKRDWGYAGDYVKAIYRINNQGIKVKAEKLKDYVVSTGEQHTVRELIELAFKKIGVEIKWVGNGKDEKGYYCGRCLVEVNPEFYRPSELRSLCGDSSRIRKELGWEPEVSFEELIEKMVKGDA